MLTIVDMREVVHSAGAFSVWNSVTDELLSDQHGNEHWASAEAFASGGFSADITGRVQYLLARHGSRTERTVAEFSASILAPDWRIVGPAFDISSDFEDPADGEMVAVWIKNDKGEEGPHLGEVVNAKKMWVNIFRFWSSGDGFIADEGNILRWAKAEHIPRSDLVKKETACPQV
jgi:hypothetical protein